LTVEQHCADDREQRPIRRSFSPDLPGVRVFLMTAAAHLPEPHRCSAADPDIDGLEPSPEWTGDATAATKFGSPQAIRAALMTERDPEGHRQMLATVAEVQRTGRPRPGSVPWSELKAELGL
jgi:hypothetical protein